MLAGGPRSTTANVAGLLLRADAGRGAARHPLWREEMFLPIVMLARVPDLDERHALANDSTLGLTAGFYGASRGRAFFERIEAGVTYANRPQGATTGAWPGYQPFGGWKGSGTTGHAIASLLLPVALPARASRARWCA
jgi:1-pyrroline-5-carboxylate dehydrogenase